MYHCTSDFVSIQWEAEKRPFVWETKSTNPKSLTKIIVIFFWFIALFTENSQSSVELISFYQSNSEMEAVSQPRFSCLPQLFISRWWEKKAVAALVARSNSWYFLLLKRLPRTEIHGALVAQKTQKSVWAAVTAMNIAQICKMLLGIAKIFSGFGTS